MQIMYLKRKLKPFKIQFDSKKYDLSNKLMKNGAFVVFD